MSPRQAAPRPPAVSKSRKSPKPPVAVEEPRPGWMDRLASVWMKFDRFGWDVLGVMLLAFAVLTLLGVLGLTGGNWIAAWVEWVRKGFGWGGILLVAFIAALGLLALRRPKTGEKLFPLGQVLALEALAFTLLAALSALGGQSLAKAEGGTYGGLIGWGLVQLLQSFLPNGLVIALIFFGVVVFTFIGFGLTGRIAAWLDALAEETPPVSAPLVAETLPQQPTPVRLRAKPAAAQTPPAKAMQQPHPRDDRLPPLTVLTQEANNHPDEKLIAETAALLERTLEEFGVPAKVRGYRVGPTVTQFAVEPGYIEKTGPDGNPAPQKVRVAQISALQRDLTRALSAERLRIEAPVPGQSFVGIEVPNLHNSMVRLRSLLEAEPFLRLNSPLALALGKDVSGVAVVADLARMPHLLIAGTTGSGKSVCIAALTACLVMNNSPEELRLAMLDPKMVELVRFNGLPHLMGKVETEIERMLAVLRWALTEMDNRYRLLETVHARDLESYNQKAQRRKLPTLPRIVLLIDELADLMMSAPDQTEHSLVRLAQMARATGIHLVVATQRPSTDVVTGLIKANFPARIAFTVASSIDSRVILDTNGAETLLGRGDMLFLNPEAGTPLRVQGVMVTDQELERLVEFWKQSTPEGEGTATEAPWEGILQVDDEAADDLVQQAVDVVRKTQRASASLLQRRLRVGYPRAARLIDQLEEMGVVGPGLGAGKDREVLLPPEDEDEESDSEE